MNVHPGRIRQLAAYLFVVRTTIYGKSRRRPIFFLFSFPSKISSRRLRRTQSVAAAAADASKAAASGIKFDTRHVPQATPIASVDVKKGVSE
jgi:hypothetical protein